MNDSDRKELLDFLHKAMPIKSPMPLGWWVSGASGVPSRVWFPTKRLQDLWDQAVIEHAELKAKRAEEKAERRRNASPRRKFVMGWLE